MTKLLVQGEVILAKDVVEVGNEIHSPDQIIPKHVVEGWQIVDVEVPDGFTCAGYTFNGLGVVKKPEPVAPVLVPESVPRRKAVKYMRRTEFSPGVSLYDHLIATINSIPDPQMRSDAMDDFMESLYFERNSPQMLGLAALAGISREQLDFHLTEADKLP
jgi:hypothetical protein